MFQTPMVKMLPPIPEERGGAIALAGYLYQLLGSAGFSLTISEHCPGAESVLIAGEVESKGGEDLFLTTFGLQGRLGDRFLVQYKFTLKPQSEAIPPGELCDIAEKMIQARKLIGMGTVRFVLISNAGLSDQSGAMQAACQGGGILKLKVHEKTKKRLKPNVIAAIAAIELVRKDFSQWTEGLDSKLASFGVLPNEVAEGINKCVGVLLGLASANGARGFTLPDLIAALTGIRGCCQITPSDLRPKCASMIGTLKKNCEQPEHPYRRDAISTIAQSIGAPLIIVEGGGGVGKTVAMVEALKTIFDEKAASYVAGNRAIELRDNHVGHLISKWRSPSIAESPYRTGHAIERLVRASGGVENVPVLIFAIDGADEVLKTSQGQYLRELIQEAAIAAKDSTRRSPRLCVILTCRDTDEIKKYVGIADFDSARLIKIETYSPEELVKVFRFHNLEQAAEELDRFLVEDTEFESGTVRSLSRSMPEKFQMFRFPFVIHQMPKLTAANKRGIINGDQRSLMELARVICEMFFKRASLRHPGVNDDAWRSILIHAAKKTHDHLPPFSRKTHWFAPAEEIPWPRDVIGLTMDEAESFGLIAVIDRSTYSWSWNLKFLANHLSNLH